MTSVCRSGEPQSKPDANPRSLSLSLVLFGAWRFRPSLGLYAFFGSDRLNQTRDAHPRSLSLLGLFASPVPRDSHEAHDAHPRMLLLGTLRPLGDLILPPRRVLRFRRLARGADAHPQTPLPGARRCLGGGYLSRAPSDAHGMH